MRASAVPVYLAILFALAGAQASASKTGSTPARTTKSVAAAIEVAKPDPASLAVVGSAAERHLFPVSDEKGLLLSCIAPEIDTNRETDVFNNCTLAPGRTLDDVMHSFIRGIHEEQHRRFKQDAEPDQEPEQKANGDSARK